MTVIESIVDELALEQCSIITTRKHLPNVLEDWLDQEEVVRAVRAFLQLHGPSGPRDEAADQTAWLITRSPEYDVMEEKLAILDQGRLEKGLG